ncbi:MAG: DUF4249 family protein [Saprospiraceae bacterium]|nr:DUF4249 family protein [Saprospiraceae bacterium]
MKEVNNTVAVYTFLPLFAMTALCVLMISCLDEIAVELPDNSTDRLVIDGVVERSPDLYRFLITVSRTQSFQESVFPLEEDVVITVLLNDRSIFNLVNGRPEIFTVEEFHQLYGTVTRSHFFNLKVETKDGLVFKSVDKSILDSPKGGSISFELVERQELNDLENLISRNYIKLKVNTPVVNESGDRLAMIWDASGVYAFVEGDCTTDLYGSARRCYVTENVNGTIPRVLLGSQVSGDVISGFEVEEITASPQFGFGYYLTLVRRAVDGEAGLYWNEVRKNQEREGTIFDTPPGAIRTNIHQEQGAPAEVLGYFYTAAVDTLRQLGTREVGGSIKLPCAANPSAAGCCNCLELPGSSYEKPRYWK